MSMGGVSATSAVAQASSGAQVAVQKKATERSEAVASEILGGAGESAERIRGVQTGTNLNVEA